MSTVERYAQGTPSYVELVTPDQQAAKAFYGPLLGWETEDVDLGEAGVYVAVSVQGDSVAGISGQMPHLAGHPAFWGVYITVDDIDAAAARVVPAGGTVEAEPFDVMGLGRMAAVKDPTGARANLWQAAESIGSVRVNEPGCPIWHELSSPDLPTATRFWADVLEVGWSSMPMDSGEDYLCLMVEGRPAGGAFPPPMEGIPPHWDVYFCVEDADATTARASELGATVVREPWDVPGVGRMAFLRDPQGGVFALMQSPPAQTPPEQAPEA